MSGATLTSGLYLSKSVTFCVGKPTALRSIGFSIWAFTGTPPFMPGLNFYFAALKAGDGCN
jgi:hypothetical protein